MDFQAAAGALRTYFTTQWKLLAPQVRIAYANGEPLDPAPKPEAPHFESWVRFHILNGFATNPNVGSRRRRERGRVEIQIFTPLGRGDGWARELADTAAFIWDTVAGGSVSDVQLGVTEFSPGGPDDELPYWVDVVSTQFRVDHLP